MFVFRFSDGRYLKDNGMATIITNKAHYDYWMSHGMTSIGVDVGPGGKYYESHMTTNLNEAKTFVSIRSVRSSNAYSWGGTIHEVETTLTLK